MASPSKWSFTNMTIATIMIYMIMIIMIIMLIMIMIITWSSGPSFTSVRINLPLSSEHLTIFSLQIWWSLVVSIAMLSYHYHRSPLPHICIFMIILSIVKRGKWPPVQLELAPGHPGLLVGSNWCFLKQFNQTNVAITIIVATVAMIAIVATDASWSKSLRNLSSIRKPLQSWQSYQCGKYRGNDCNDWKSHLDRSFPWQRQERVKKVAILAAHTLNNITVIDIITITIVTSSPSRSVTVSMSE